MEIKEKQGMSLDSQEAEINVATRSMFYAGGELSEPVW